MIFLSGREEEGRNTNNSALVEEKCASARKREMHSGIINQPMYFGIKHEHNWLVGINTYMDRKNDMH